MDSNEKKNGMRWSPLVVLAPFAHRSHARFFSPFEHVLNTYFIRCHLYDLFFPVYKFSYVLFIFFRRFFFFFLFHSAFTAATYTRPFCQHFIAGATGCYRYYFALHTNYFPSISIYRIIYNFHLLHRSHRISFALARLRRWSLRIPTLFWSIIWTYPIPMITKWLL